jgi:hypothetical protein
LEDDAMKAWRGCELGVTVSAMVVAVAAAGCTASAGTTGAGTGSSGSANGCAADPSLSCDMGSSGVDCPPGDDPKAAFPGDVCSAPAVQADGTDGYCCATGFTPGTTSCVQDASVQSCEYPALGFSCSGSDSPGQADPSLSCSTGTADPSTGLTLYCCQ